MINKGFLNGDRQPSIPFAEASPLQVEALFAMDYIRKHPIDSTSSTIERGEKERKFKKRNEKKRGKGNAKRKSQESGNSLANAHDIFLASHQRNC